MTSILTHEHVESFRRARQLRDAQQIEPFLDDKVDWLLTGPIELLRFCGQRQGKAEVLNCLTRQDPEVLGAFKIDLDTLMIEHDRAATLSRMTGIQRSTGAPSVTIKRNSCSSATER